MSEQMEADVADVGHVVDAAVVLALVLNAEHSEHVHHARDLLLHRHHLEEIVLDVDVALEVVAQLESFDVGLQLQASAQVPISACHEHEVAFLQLREGFQPDVEFHEGTLDVNAIGYPRLRDPRELSAEVAELGVELRHYVVVKGPYLLEVLRVNQHNRKLNYFRAGLDFLVFDAGGLEVEHKQVVEFHILQVCSSFFGHVLLYFLLPLLGPLLPLCLFEVVLDVIDLLLGEGSAVPFDEFNANCADVEDVVDAAVVLSLVLQSQILQHLHHARHATIRFHHDVVVLLDVDVGVQEGFDSQFFVFGLSLQAVGKVPVSAGHKGVVVLLDVGQLQEPLFHAQQHLLNGATVLHHLLSYSSELGAEFGQDRVEFGLDVLVELIQYFSGVGVHDDDRKLNDFWAGLDLLVLDAGGLKVKHQQVLYLGVVFHLFFYYKEEIISQSFDSPKDPQLCFPFVCGSKQDIDQFC